MVMIESEVYVFTCSGCGHTGFVADEPGNYLVPVNCPNCGEFSTAMPQDLSIEEMEKMLYFLQVNCPESSEV